MTMPPAEQHVARALELSKAAQEAVGNLAGFDKVWRTDITTRLSAAVTTLGTIADRFFVKTRLAVPFARRCEEAARALEAAVAQTSAQTPADGQKAIGTALETYLRTVRALDEQSQMKGMAIT